MGNERRIYDTDKLIREINKMKTITFSKLLTFKLIILIHPLKTKC